jgi:hypothetical protein
MQILTKFVNRDREQVDQLSQESKSRERRHSQFQPTSPKYVTEEKTRNKHPSMASYRSEEMDPQSWVTRNMNYKEDRASHIKSLESPRFIEQQKNSRRDSHKVSKFSKCASELDLQKGRTLTLECLEAPLLKHSIDDDPSGDHLNTQRHKIEIKHRVNTGNCIEISDTYQVDQESTSSLNLQNQFEEYNEIRVDSGLSCSQKSDTARLKFERNKNMPVRYSKDLKDEEGYIQTAMSTKAYNTAEKPYEKQICKNSILEQDSLAAKNQSLTKQLILKISQEAELQKRVSELEKLLIETQSELINNRNTQSTINYDF